MKTVRTTVTSHEDDPRVLTSMTPPPPGAWVSIRRKDGLRYLLFLRGGGGAASPGR
jgi:hypothetical protein